MQPQEILKKYFGYDSFRHRQREAVDNILSGRDVLCVMPTGAGKSLCYQVPAMAMDGVSIIISPLISLMKDQVMSLNKNGIPAAYLNSSLTVNQYLKALDYMKQGRYKIVYVAPERLLTPSFLSACREQGAVFIRPPAPVFSPLPDRKTGRIFCKYLLNFCELNRISPSTP